MAGRGTEGKRGWLGMMAGRKGEKKPQMARMGTDGERKLEGRRVERMGVNQDQDREEPRMGAEGGKKTRLCVVLGGGSW